MSSAVADVVRDVYRSYHGTGWHVVSDFGEAAVASARVPDDDTAPVGVELVVNERSVLRHVTGERMDMATTTWRMQLTLDGNCTEIGALAVGRA
jgi:hypothetical protein